LRSRAARFHLEDDAGSPPERIVNLAVTVQPSPTAGLTVGYLALGSLDVRVSGSFANTPFDLTGVSAGLADVEGFTTFGGLGNLNVWTWVPPTK
jgi:hypothetical protein